MRGRCTLPTHRSAAAATSGHSARRGGKRLHCRSVCSFSGRELGCNRRGTDCSRDFVIVAAASQIDDVRVMRVLENPREIPLTQTFAVATEKCAGC
jgi:hypothetical protein